MANKIIGYVVNHGHMDIEWYLPLRSYRFWTVEALDLLRRGTVIPAIPLALDEDRRFAPPWQRLLTRYYLEAGAGGIAIAVHTTQFAIRDPEHNLLAPVLEAVLREIEAYERESGRVALRVAGWRSSG